MLTRADPLTAPMSRFARPSRASLLAVSLAGACGGSDHRVTPAHAATLPSTTLVDGGGFVLRTVRDGGVDYKYQVFVPRAPSAARRPPVILFLHGSGQIRP